MSHAIWYPELKRAHVTVAKGILFASLGHSASRENAGSDGTLKIQKRMELLPEETLYLVERGAMYCWKPTDLLLAKASLLDDMEGVPMSVQQAYAEMIGTEDLTLEKYQVRAHINYPSTGFIQRAIQVYAYLKRLGYVVTRTKPPSPDYPTPPPFPRSIKATSVLDKLYSGVVSFFVRLARIFVSDRNWWQPICYSGRLFHTMSNREYPFLTHRGLGSHQFL